jgi:hypothetical protein
MSLEIEKLVRRVAALESRLAAEGDKKEDKKEEKEEDSAEEKEASERQALAAQIEALESRIAADDAEEDDEEKDDEKTASLVDPNGVEEQITLDRFTEVEDLEHGTELSDGLPLDVAPTGYVARLKNASTRLDAVANYLEKTGRAKMALRIDKVADSIDARLASIEKA